MFQKFITELSKHAIFIWQLSIYRNILRYLRLFSREESALRGLMVAPLPNEEELFTVFSLVLEEPKALAWLVWLTRSKSI